MDSQESGPSHYIIGIVLIVIIAVLLVSTVVLILTGSIKRIIALKKNQNLTITPIGPQVSQTFANSYLFNPRTNLYVDHEFRRLTVSSSGSSLWSFDGVFLNLAGTSLYVMVETDLSLRLAPLPPPSQTRAQFTFIFQGNVFFYTQVITSTISSYIYVSDDGQIGVISTDVSNPISPGASFAVVQS